jgi:hypothetical protein
MTEPEQLLLTSLIETRDAVLACLKCLAESADRQPLSRYLPAHCHGYGERLDKAIALAKTRCRPHLAN